MGKNNITKYLLIGGAIYAALYLFKKPQQIKGISASTKYKFTFIAVLWGRDENNLKNNLLDKKFFSTTAVNQYTAKMRAIKKFPLPYELELYSTEKI